MNVWDRALTPEEIKDMATCKNDYQGSYISWNKGWTLYNVESYDVSQGFFCEKSTGSIYFWFSDEPYLQSYYLCEALGTHLPLPRTFEESDGWLELSRKTWGNETRCSYEIIVSINDIQNEGSWVKHYNNEIVPLSETAWKDGEPNGLQYENCGMIEFNGMADIDCLTRVQCAVCEFKDQIVYSLLGTCEYELRNINFLAYQDDINDLNFKGYGEYHIRREGEHWKWINIADNTTIATMITFEPNFPMGRRMWKLERQVCKQKTGERMLLLTPCTEDQYSCDDATCIPLENRCDLKYDCLDHSDEANCQLVVIPSDYKEELPPRQTAEGGKEATSLPVTIDIRIESMAVDTTMMTMQMSYEFQLTWLDNRLTFLNIKVNDSLNKFPFKTMTSLWTPTVGYVNTDGNQYTVVNTESTMFVRRISFPFRRDDSAPAESKKLRCII